MEPIAIYRGQLVAVHARHERTCVIADYNGTKLLVATAELQFDVGDIMERMREDDGHEGTAPDTNTVE